LISPVIIIPIRKQEHVDFIRNLFNGTRGLPIKITRNEFTGKFIFSLRQYSALPKQQIIPDGYIPVAFEFPETEYSQHKKHFCYYSLENIEMINDFISAFFDLYFHIYFFDTTDIDHLTGSDEFGNIEITKQMLVESFVVGLDMFDFSKSSETIKKREYRKSVKEMVRKQKKFLQKDYLFRKKLYDKRRNNIYSIVFQHIKQQ
jgi:hypothetical protein